jgi:hypothetical protein
VHIDAIREWPGDASVVPINISWRTCARSGCIARATAGARVRRADQCKACRVRHRLRGARDDDLRIFYRLPERVEDMPRKLQHFVQEQDSVVREAHLTRTRMRPATNQACRRYSVMGSTKRPNSTAHSILIE